LRIGTIFVFLCLLFAFPQLVFSKSDSTKLKKTLIKKMETDSDSYIQIGKILTGKVAKAKHKGFEKVLRKGACYRFAAIGVREIESLGIRVFFKGKLFAKSEDSDFFPKCSFCVTEDMKIEAQVYASKGKGEFALGFFAKSSDENIILEENQAEARIALEENARSIAKKMTQVGEIQTGYLKYHTTKEIEFYLPSSRCYKFIAAGAAGVQDLSLSVIENKKEIAFDRISGKNPAAQWCAPSSTTVIIQLSMYAGEGAFALGVFGSTKKTTAAPEKVGGVESDFISNRIRQLHVQYGNGRAAISSVFRGNLSANSEKIFFVKLTSGHCYSVISAGNPSVRSMEFVLLDHRDEEVARAKTENSFPIIDTEPCLKQTGRYKIKVKMKRGFGQFGLQVFSD